MKKMSKELKAGLVAIGVLFLFVWGFSFLKGKNLLKGAANTYYTTYQNINGLKKSSEVTINGFSVGKVMDIYFDTNPKKKGSLIVEFMIENTDIVFSKNSIAKIYSGGLMGGKSLAIHPVYDGEMAESGDYLKGEVEAGIMTSFSNKLDPIQAKVSSTLTNIDAVAKDVNQLLNKDMIRNLQQSVLQVNQILTTLQGTTKSINAMVLKNGSNLDATLNNMTVTTQNLKTFSDSLSKVEILAISQKMSNTVASLDKITSDIKNGNGTIGKLTKEEGLYNNLESASKELEELLREIKERPKRFVHFSLFGKKAERYKETTEN